MRAFEISEAPKRVSMTRIHVYLANILDITVSVEKRVRANRLISLDYISRPPDKSFDISTNARKMSSITLKPSRQCRSAEFDRLPRFALALLALCPL